MDKLAELRAQLKQIDEKIDNLLANEELTAEQTTEHNKLVKDREKTVAAIAKEKDRNAREQERQQLELEAKEAEQKAAEMDAAKKAAEKKAGRTVPGNRLTTPDEPTGQSVVTEPTVKTTLPATVKRYGSIKHFAGIKIGRTAEDRAYRFGQWALSMLSKQLPNRYHFEDAEQFSDRNFAIHTSTNSSGAQYLIPDEFSTDIIDLRERFGVVRRLFKVVRMSSDTLHIPRRAAGLTAYFIAEGGAKQESTMTWDEIMLVARELAVLSRWTNQVDADAVINFGDALAGEISYAFTEKEDQCGINGDGTSTYGGILGVRTKLQDVDGAGTDSAGLVTASGNLYSEITLTDFEAVAGLLPVFADTPQAAWVMHKKVYFNVAKRLELAAGGVTSQEISSGGTRGNRPLFMGYPVEFSQVMPSTEANSQVMALLGDFTQGAVFGDRQQDGIMFSEHATVGGESVFERNQIAIRGSERFDIKVHGVGTASVVGPIVGLQTAAS